MLRTWLCVVATAFLAAAFLGACGSGDEAADTSTSASSEVWEEGPGKEVTAYMERYRSEEWFSNIKEIDVADGVALVTIYFEPEPALDHRYGVQICKAIVTSNQIKRAIVFWARVQTVKCKDEGLKAS